MRALALMSIAAGCAHAPRPMVPCAQRARQALALSLAGGVTGGWGGAFATIGGAVDDLATRWTLAGIATGLAAASVVTTYLGAYRTARLASTGCQ